MSYQRIDGKVSVMGRQVVLPALLVIIVGAAGCGANSSPPSSAAAAWHVVSLGDSIPYGADDCGQCRTYTDLYGAWIQKTTGHRVVVKNLSQHDNLSAAQMADDLSKDPGRIQPIKSANIVLLSIGFNDTPWNSLDDACDGNHGFFDGNPKASWTALLGPCLQTELRRYRANLGEILTEIDRARAGRPTAVRLTTQYSDFGGPPGKLCCPQIATQVAAKIKVAFNKVECEVATAHHATCVDLLHPFNGPTGTTWPGDLIGPDGTHPSARGHQRIAELLEASGVGPLARERTHK
jgi:lysophospholipase L1-like esterase